MSNVNYYLIRPYPNGVNRIKEFKERGCIGIGWSNLGTVSGMREPELRAALEEYLNENNEKKLRSTLGTFKIFCLDLKVGDFIIAPENKMGDIHTARVTGDYYFDSNSIDLDFAHQRKVEWSDVVIPRSKIEMMNNKRLPGALKFPGTAANLQEYNTELSALLTVNIVHELENLAESYAEGRPQILQASYPLRPNTQCHVSFPADMTAGEAQRFATFVSTLHFNSTTN